MADQAEKRLARGEAADGASGRGEPALHDIIEDPITRRLMASDGVRHDHLVKLLGEARAKLARRR